MRRLTNLDGAELDSFMVEYQPPYEIALYTSDYDFQTYIKASFERYKLEKARKGEGVKRNN